MHEIDRWEGEGGLTYDLTHRERILKILKEAGIPFEEDPFREEGTENDIVIEGYESSGAKIYFAFENDGFLFNIGAYTP